MAREAPHVTLAGRRGQAVTGLLLPAVMARVPVSASADGHHSLSRSPARASNGAAAGRFTWTGHHLGRNPRLDDPDAREGQAHLANDRASVGSPCDLPTAVPYSWARIGMTDSRSQAVTEPTTAAR